MLLFRTAFFDPRRRELFALLLQVLLLQPVKRGHANNSSPIRFSMVFVVVACLSRVIVFLRSFMNLMSLKSTQSLRMIYKLFALSYSVQLIFIRALR